jgi:hypothetical protein
MLGGDHGHTAGGLLVGGISLDHTPHRADQFAGRDLDQVAITQDRAVRKMRDTVETCTSAPPTFNFRDGD